MRYDIYLLCGTGKIIRVVEFLYVQKNVEDIRNDVSHQTTDVVWNVNVFDMNRSIVENQTASLNVQQTETLLDI
jgi:hypothetical protein